jgi:hypothetical protein
MMLTWTHARHSNPRGLEKQQCIPSTRSLPQHRNVEVIESTIEGGVLHKNWKEAGSDRIVLTLENRQWLHVFG